MEYTSFLYIYFVAIGRFWSHSFYNWQFHTIEYLNMFATMYTGNTIELMSCYAMKRNMCCCHVLVFLGLMAWKNLFVFFKKRSLKNYNNMQRCKYFSGCCFFSQNVRMKTSVTSWRHPQATHTGAATGSSGTWSRTHAASQQLTSRQTEHSKRCTSKRIVYIYSKSKLKVNRWLETKKAECC